VKEHQFRASNKLDQQCEKL